MAPVYSKPGVLLVHPRLRSPNDSNAQAFHRWTKLHFRDLLNISMDASSAKVDACVRGTALERASNYSHEEKPGVKPAYMYNCFVNDIGVLKSQPYYEVSRKLNLEQTRSLGEDEEPVGYNNNDKNAMVFDIVDAKFAVYEEIERPSASGDLRNALASAIYTWGSSQAIVRINLCTSNGWDLHLAKKAVDHLETSLPNTDLGGTAMTALALYQWAGKEAQPDEHPLIDVEGNAELMILVLVQFIHSISHEDLSFMANDAIGKSFQKFAEGAGGHGTGKIFDYGIWAAEISNTAREFGSPDFELPGFDVPHGISAVR